MRVCDDYQVASRGAFAVGEWRHVCILRVFQLEPEAVIVDYFINGVFTIQSLRIAALGIINAVVKEID